MRFSPVNGAHTGHRVTVTHPFCQQSISDFPGKHGGILPLVLCDLLHNLRGGHLGFRATDYPRFDAACFIIPVRDGYCVNKKKCKKSPDVSRKSKQLKGHCKRKLGNVARRCAHRPRILLTQPWLTRSCRDMSQGRTPWWAMSTMRCRITSGSGRPLTNIPPSWLRPPWPGGGGGMNTHKCHGTSESSTHFTNTNFCLLI